MHLLIQTTTFLLFPLIALFIRPFFYSVDSVILWSGIYYLCVLPSTVSTSVVMVSISGGNVPAAIFNASLSGIAGVFITPLWMSFMSTSGNTTMDLTMIVIKLIVQILLPVILGMFLHSRFGKFAEQNKKQLRRFDQIIILAIVYTSFAHSFVNKAFSGIGFNRILLLGIGMVVLFIVVFGLLYTSGRFLGFTEADRKTVAFCGSKKSLVHGSVMASVFFQHAATAGVILLPLMIYHALQIVFASMIAGKMKSN